MLSDGGRGPKDQIEMARGGGVMLVVVAMHENLLLCSELRWAPLLEDRKTNVLVARDGVGKAQASALQSPGNTTLPQAHQHVAPTNSQQGLE